MERRSLQLAQLNNKMLAFASLRNVAIPPTGWVKAIRTAIGMSLNQLGKKLSITRQSAQAIEKRERDGSLTIQSMKTIAKALDMQFVYGFVPIDGSLQALIDRKSRELAIQIVMRASNNMRLEDQENSDKRIEKAIEERAGVIKNEMPKILWD